MCLIIHLYGSEVLRLERTCSASCAAFTTAECALCVEKYSPYHPTSHLVEQPLCPPWNRAFRNVLSQKTPSLGGPRLPRMPSNRLPRMLLTEWVANPRPLGCAQVTWGRTLKKALRGKDLPTELAEWCRCAADRDRLRLVCYRSNRQLAPGADRPYGQK